MKTLSVTALLVAALTLAGCQSFALFGGGGKPNPKSSNANAYAAGPLADADPITTVSVSKTGNGIGSEVLTIEIDGKRFELPLIVATGLPPVGGRTYQLSGYGAASDVPGATNIAEAYSLQHTSLILLAEDVTLADVTGGTLNFLRDNYALIATGTVATPVGNLPAQIVEYDGLYSVIIGQGSLGQGGAQTTGVFTAVADFSANTVNVNASNGLLEALATIEGNQFTGAISHSSAAGNFSGQIAGGFYGPNAEEIAGVAGGTVTQGGSTQDFSAGFIGAQTP